VLLTSPSDRPLPCRVGLPRLKDELLRAGLRIGLRTGLRVALPAGLLAGLRPGLLVEPFCLFGDPCDEARTPILPAEDDDPHPPADETLPPRPPPYHPSEEARRSSIPERSRWRSNEQPSRIDATVAGDAWTAEAISRCSRNLQKEGFGQCEFSVRVQCVCGGVRLQ
jgi:hypothetical protein